MADLTATKTDLETAINGYTDPVKVPLFLVEQLGEINATLGGSTSSANLNAIQANIQSAIDALPVGAQVPNYLIDGLWAVTRAIG